MQFADVQPSNHAFDWFFIWQYSVTQSFFRKSWKCLLLPSGIRILKIILKLRRRHILHCTLLTYTILFWMVLSRTPWYRVAPAELSTFQVWTFIYTPGVL
jgi:hypothetical protein